MYTKNDAARIVREYDPERKIDEIAEYKGQWILATHTDDPYEGHMDGYFAVDRKTGKLSGWAYLSKENIEAWQRMFLK